MKSLVVSLFVLTAVVAAFAADIAVDYLRARSNGSAVVIEWRSGSENGLRSFELERAGEDQVFRYVATIEAKGNKHTYTYTDEEAFGKRDANDGNVASTYFTYRLKFVGENQNVSYSSTAGVSHSVSSVRRTWGMIKEMFR